MDYYNYKKPVKKEETLFPVVLDNSLTDEYPKTAYVILKDSLYLMENSKYIVEYEYTLEGREPVKNQRLIFDTITSKEYSNYPNVPSISCEFVNTDDGILTVSMFRPALFGLSGPCGLMMDGTATGRIRINNIILYTEV